jgi:hypothetical protein
MSSKNTKTAFALVALIAAAVGGWYIQNKPIQTGSSGATAPASTGI